jgi:calcium-dependent protein kinase
MKQAALTAISVQASPDDIKDLKNLFMSLDVNGDGSLTIEEVRKGLEGKENGDALLEIM